MGCSSFSSLKSHLASKVARRIVSSILHSQVKTKSMHLQGAAGPYWKVLGRPEPVVWQAGVTVARRQRRVQECLLRGVVSLRLVLLGLGQGCGWGGEEASPRPNFTIVTCEERRGSMYLDSFTPHINAELPLLVSHDPGQPWLNFNSVNFIFEAPFSIAPGHTAQCQSRTNNAWLCNAVAEPSFQNKAPWFLCPPVFFHLFPTHPPRLSLLLLHGENSILDLKNNHSQ